MVLSQKGTYQALPIIIISYAWQSSYYGAQHIHFHMVPRAQTSSTYMYVVSYRHAAPK